MVSIEMPNTCVCILYSQTTISFCLCAHTHVVTHRNTFACSYALLAHSVERWLPMCPLQGRQVLSSSQAHPVSAALVIPLRNLLASGRSPKIHPLRGRGRGPCAHVGSGSPGRPGQPTTTTTTTTTNNRREPTPGNDRAQGETYVVRGARNPPLSL